MASSYFRNFQTIDYFGSIAIDITERAVFKNSTLANPYVFYPYDVNGNERPDQFANRYYGDSFKDWILYLGNKMTDPYYEWYVNDDDFNNFINLKYGSIQLAQSKVYYYENNWYNSYPNTIQVNAYDALPISLYKYWTPVYDVYNNISSYTRVQNDDTITTNGIRSYNVMSNNFIIDEVCTIAYDYNANNVGFGQIMSVAGNTVYMQHIYGNTISNTTSNSYMFGSESQTNTSFSSPSIVCDNLLPEEEIYWSPVTYFQYETNINENNKTIQILDSAYGPSAVKELKSLLAIKL